MPFENGCAGLASAGHKEHPLLGPVPRSGRVGAMDIKDRMAASCEGTAILSMPDRLAACLLKSFLALDDWDLSFNETEGIPEPDFQTDGRKRARKGSSYLSLAAIRSKTGMMAICSCPLVWSRR